LDASEDDSQLDPAKVPSVVQEKALWDAALDNWKRAQALEQETAISGEELQQRKSAVDVAAARYESALHTVNESVAQLGVRRAELGMARQALEDAEVRAPFDGVVEQRYVAPGAFVQVGAPIVMLDKVNPWRFRASVPEREAASVQLGQQTLVRVEGEPNPLKATVTRISPSVDLSNRSLTIEASPAAAVERAAVDSSTPPATRLRRGLFAEADIEVDPESRALAVPRSAVREFAGVEKVWLIVNGAAVEQRVVTGRRTAEQVEVREGLAEKDVVVVEGFPQQAGAVEVVGQR
jgi:RND family efflux transporter MFP subunit